MALQGVLLFSGDWVASSYYGAAFRTDLDNVLGAGGIGTWTLEANNVGAATTTLEHNWFVMRHNVTDHQIFFFVGIGSDAEPQNILSSASFPTDPNVGVGSYNNTDMGWWMSQDPLGGGAGSGSFYDQGYLNGFTPGDDEFWEDGAIPRTHIAGFCTLNDDQVGTGLVSDLYLIYDDDPNIDTIMFVSRRSTVAPDLFVFALMGSATLDESKVLVPDRIASPGMVFIGFNNTSGTNPREILETSNFGIRDFADGGAFSEVQDYDEYSVYSDYLNQTVNLEPQDGTYTTANVPIFASGANGRIIGSIDDDWIKFITPVTTDYKGKRTRPSDSREYIHFIRELIVAWPPGLAVPP